MSELSHLRLENTATPLPFTAHRTRGGREFATPVRDRAPHAQKLISDVRTAVAAVDAERAAQETPDEIDGYSLTLASDPDFSLRLESLDKQRDGMELLSARTESGVADCECLCAEGQAGRLCSLDREVP